MAQIRYSAKGEHFPSRNYTTNWVRFRAEPAYWLEDS